MKNRRFSIGRYRQIIAIFTKHGFGLLMDQLGIFRYLKMKRQVADIRIDKFSTGERLRMSLEELGPAFIKLGQILSTRPDMLPPDIMKELKKLQDSVPPFPFSQVREVIEKEFEDPLENIFMEFEEKPVAAASISQVHRAKISSGKLVAVKVQRPNIEKIFQQDLNILKDFAQFITNHTQYGELYDLNGMVEEFENTINHEIDFTKEGENAEKFKQNFSQDKGIRVPEVKWIYTTKRVLTMTYIEGIRVDDEQGLNLAGIDKDGLAKKLAMSICNQILRDGFFHADPHPGNIRVMPDSTLVFLDMGMVGQLDEKRKRMISNFFIGVVSRDSQMVVRSIVDLDTRHKYSNLRQFERDVDKIIDKYLTLPLDQIKIGEVFYETFNIAFANHIKIPREFALIAKALGTLQGLLEMLSPDLNPLVIAKPIAKKLVSQSFSTELIGNEIRKGLRNYRELFKVLPATFLHFSEKLEEDGFVFQHEMKEVSRIEKCINRGIDRMAFSIVLLAVSIILAGIIIGSGLSAGVGTVNYLLNVRVLKIGLIFALCIVLGLIISTIRANRT